MFTRRSPSSSATAGLRRLAAAAILLTSTACTSDRTAQSANAATGTAATGEGAAAATDGRVEIGLPAPAYTTVNLNGDSVSLAAQRGKVVLLNVWATWCHPCRKEIPELRAIRDRYQAQGLELIGVSVDTDGTDDAIRGFMQEFSMDFPIWRDPDERVSTQFLVVGVPATFLIDKNGVLRWRKTGPVAPGDTALTAAIERALGGS